MFNKTIWKDVHTDRKITAIHCSYKYANIIWKGIWLRHGLLVYLTHSHTVQGSVPEHASEQQYEAFTQRICSISFCLEQRIYSSLLLHTTTSSISSPYERRLLRLTFLCTKIHIVFIIFLTFNIISANKHISNPMHLFD